MKDSENFKWIKPSEDKREKILKLIEGKSIDEKFNLAVKNNVNWLIENCVNDGLNLNDYYIEKVSVGEEVCMITLYSVFTDFWPRFINEEECNFLTNLGIKLLEF